MTDTNLSLSLDYSAATGGPQFSTYVVNTVSGKEQRNIDRWDPLRLWRVKFSELKKPELDTLTAFFEARQGRLDTFLWRRPFSISDVRVRFNQDELRAQIDSGADTSSCEIELLEVHLAYGDTPPASFAADSGVQIPSTYGATLTGGPSFSTTVVAAATGIEQRKANRPKIRRWTINYGGLDLSSLGTLEAFFAARKGRAQTFLFAPPGAGSTVKVRFDNDDFAATYLMGQTAVIGQLDLIEVL